MQKQSKQVITPKNVQFLKYLKKGKSKKESAILAGYNPNSASITASKILKKDIIQRTLAKSGLTLDVIAKGYKTAFESGLGVKATNSDSVRVLDSLTTMLGFRDTEKQDTTNTTIQINELKILNIDTLQDRLKAIDQDIKGNT